LNSGFHACKSGAVPFESHLQSIVLLLFCWWGLLNYLPGWSWTAVLLISASRVGGITEVSHKCWLVLFFSAQLVALYSGF
jgi:hypothetical protein